MNQSILILQLTLVTFERLAIIIGIAFIMTRLSFFRKMLEEAHDNLNKILVIKLILVFSFIGVLGTLFGVVIDIEENTYKTFTQPLYAKIGNEEFWDAQFSPNEAIINFRVMILVAAGLIGGPVVGFMSGIFVGLFRYSLGGFSAEIFIFSSALVGLSSGLLYLWLEPKQRYSPIIAMVICFLAELIRAVFLMVPDSSSQGVQLMEVISIPMISGNVIGCYIFIRVVNIVNMEVSHTSQKVKLLEQEAENKIESIKSMAFYHYPHIFGPCLSGIRCDIVDDPPQAIEQTIALSMFARISCSNINQWEKGIKVRDEVDHIENYIKLMKYQFKKIQYIIDYDSSINLCKCQPFILQPLVGNAISHGCKKRTRQEYKIVVGISNKKEQICFSVQDNGVGISEEVRQKLGKEKFSMSKSGSGAGFYNTVNHLEAIYGEDFSYKVTSLQPGTLVQLFIPKKECIDE